jgi:hypothetical protein
VGFFDRVTNLREKANRLGLDENADQRKKDRNDEARKRLDAGRRTLSAVLEGGPDAVATQVSQHAGQGEAVGKITQVMASAAPVLQQNAPAVKNVIAQIDAAKSELANAGANIQSATASVESAMTNLVASTNIGLPTNLVADLAADAVEDNTPKTTANEENAEATEATSPAATPEAPNKKRRRKKELADVAAAVKPVATGRRKVRDVASASGFVDSIRVPSNIADVVRNPVAAAQGVAANAQQTVDSAVSAVSSPADALGGGGFGKVLGGLGGLGGGGGFDLGPVSIGRDGVTLSHDLGGGTEGSVTVGKDGVSLDASRDIGGGRTGTLGVTIGEDGPSVHGEVSQETALGTVTAGVEVGADGPGVYGEIEGRHGHGSISADADGVTVEGEVGPLSGERTISVLAGLLGGAPARPNAPGRSRSDAVVAEDGAQPVAPPAAASAVPTPGGQRWVRGPVPAAGRQRSNDIVGDRAPFAPAQPIPALPNLPSPAFVPAARRRALRELANAKANLPPAAAQVMAMATSVAPPAPATVAPANTATVAPPAPATVAPTPVAPTQVAPASVAPAPAAPAVDPAQAAKEAEATVFGWMPGDDLDTVHYFGTGLKKCATLKPDHLQANKQFAGITLASLRANDALKAIAPADLEALAWYTTDAAYPMNAILRGLLKSQPWLDAYGKYTAGAARALAALPQGARNFQGKDEAEFAKYAKKSKVERMFSSTKKLDPDLVDRKQSPDAIVPIKAVYRNSSWFGVPFAQDYRVGNTIVDKAFVSTTLIKDSYGKDMPIKWTINNAQVGRSLLGISAQTEEKEVLLPPGQQFKITRIILIDKVKKTQTAVADPIKAYPKSDGGDQAYNNPNFIWEVELTHVSTAVANPATANSNAPATGAQDSIDLFTLQPPGNPSLKWGYASIPNNWKPERRALHDKLLATAQEDAVAFAKAAPSAEPTVYAMRGNTAAGKTRAVANNVPELQATMQKTSNNAFRAVNPDVFKPALMTAGGQNLTSAQVHTESSVLGDRFQAAVKGTKLEDGKPASMLIDKRLASTAEVRQVADLGKTSGRKFVLYDVEASLETSLAGVLERQPGGMDPLPPYDIVATGFKLVRDNRAKVVDMFTSDPTLGSYELFSAQPSGDRVPVATVKAGALTILDQKLYDEAIASPDQAPALVGSTPITEAWIQQFTASFAGDRRTTMQSVLRPYIGKTWREAVDAHSKKQAPVAKKE